MIGTDATHYGMELIIDATNCDSFFMTEKSISKFLKILINVLGVEIAQPPFFWIEDTPIAHLQGLSCIQFIKTSNITIHTLDITKTMYMNIFSCKYFDREKVEGCITDYFKGIKIESKLIFRG
jgi:S-adenosylmethionine/arginine decarboxylase-like enzyme